jgi:hypothetical protein
MSTINGISNNSQYPFYSTNAVNDPRSGQVSDRQSSPPSHSEGGIISAIQAALSRIGLSMKQSGTVNGADSTSTGDASDAQKVLYKFMHDLFTAMQNQSSRTSSNTAYSSPMTTSIQDIIKALESSSNTSGDVSVSIQTSDLDSLKSDFQGLVSAMGGDAEAGSSTASLQKFLHILDSNLKRSSVNFINTTA